MKLVYEAFFFLLYSLGTLVYPKQYNWQVGTALFRWPWKERPWKSQNTRVSTPPPFSLPLNKHALISWRHLPWHRPGATLTLHLTPSSINNHCVDIDKMNRLWNPSSFMLQGRANIWLILGYLSGMDTLGINHQLPKALWLTSLETGLSDQWGLTMGAYSKDTHPVTNITSLALHLPVKKKSSCLQNSVYWPHARTLSLGNFLPHSPF